MSETEARKVLRIKPDPLGIPRNPLAVYLLLLALLSGLLMMVGINTAQSVEDALPGWVAQGWGANLAFGSAITLVGMYWPGDIRSGLLMKRIGMLSLMVASGVYTIVLLVAFGMAGSFSAGIVAGFGVACAVQFHVINERIKAILVLTTKEA